MQLLSRLFRSAPASLENRDRPPDTDDFWYQESPSMGRWASPDSAMGIGAVYACVDVYTRSAAVLPIGLYRRGKGTDRERVQDHPLAGILGLRPNGYMTHYQFIQLQLRHVLTGGNSYAQVMRNRRGEVTRLLPLHPSRVTPRLNLDSGALEYEFQMGAEKRIFKAREILHFKALSHNGLLGVSPITEARLEFEVMEALNQQSATLFRNRSVPPLALIHPSTMTDQQSKRMRDSWQAAQTGANYGKAAVLEGGMRIERLGLSAEDAQFAERVQLSIQSAARIFGLPPHMIGELSKATFSNIEQQSIQYVVYSLLPWLKTMEESMMFTLLNPDEEKTYFIEFLVDGLMRGDFKTRQEGLAVQRQNGVITANEWRRLENYNAFDADAGDKVLVNGNMISVKSIPDTQPVPEAPEEVEIDIEDSEEEQKEASNEERKATFAPSIDTLKGHFRAVFSDILGRALTKESNVVQREERKLDAQTRLLSFFDEHRSYVKKVLRPSVELYVATVQAMTGRSDAHMDDTVELSLMRSVDLYDKSRSISDDSARLRSLTESLIEEIKNEATKES